MEKMKKRIRKKLYKGEFQELGFQILLRIDLQDQYEIDRFIDDLQEYNYPCGMSLCGGGCPSEENQEIFELRFLFTPQKRGSLTEHHRKLISEWCKNKNEIVEYNSDYYLALGSDEGLLILN